MIFHCLFLQKLFHRLFLQKFFHCLFLQKLFQVILLWYWSEKESQRITWINANHFFILSIIVVKICCFRNSVIVCESPGSVFLVISKYILTRVATLWRKHLKVHLYVLYNIISSHSLWYWWYIQVVYLNQCKDCFLNITL